MTNGQATIARSVATWQSSYEIRSLDLRQDICRAIADYTLNFAVPAAMRLALPIEPRNNATLTGYNAGPSLSVKRRLERRVEQLDTVLWRDGSFFSLLTLFYGKGSLNFLSPSWVSMV